MSARGARRRSAAWRSWGLVLAAAAAPYANSLGNSFHYDDEHALLRNPHLRQLANIPRFFVDSTTFSAEPDMAMYRPLLLTTFAANYAQGAYQPTGYHLVNTLLHALAAAAVYAIFCHLLGAGPAALTGAVLFAVHPVHTQAVNYISSRSEVLCAALVLWALYLGGLRRRTGWGLVAYGAALLSKSAAVALLPLLVVFELERARPARAWRRLAPFAALTAAYVALLTVEGFLPRSLAQEVRPLAQQWWTQTKVLAYYLRLATFPAGLSVEHDFQLSASLLESPVLLSAALATSLVGLALVRVRRGDRVAAGGLWFFAGLGLTFVLPLNVLVNEHRLYLPMAGFSLALVAPFAGPRDSAVGVWRGRFPAGAVMALSAAGLALLAGMTWQRNRVWRDELSLWSDAAARAPGSFRAWSNLGLAEHEAGRRQQARATYERALRLNPGYARTWNNLALVLEDLGDGSGAEAAYRRAGQLAPAFSGPRSNLGRLYLQAGRPEPARLLLEEAVGLNPFDLEALVNLGRLEQDALRPEEARRLYEEALRIDPGYPAAINNLALLKAESGDLDGGRQLLVGLLRENPDYEDAAVNLALLDLEGEGVAEHEAYRRVIERFPGRGEPVLALGRLLGRWGEWGQAVQTYESALARGARAPGLRAALGDAYQASGRLEEAIAQYRLAASEAPGDLRVLNNLAAACAAAGHLEAALEVTSTVLEIDPANRRAKANLQRLRTPAGAEPIEGK